MFSTPKVANKPPSNAGSKKKDLSLTYEPNSLEEMIGNKEQIK